MGSYILSLFEALPGNVSADDVLRYVGEHNRSGGLDPALFWEFCIDSLNLHRSTRGYARQILRENGSSKDGKSSPTPTEQEEALIRGKAMGVIPNPKDVRLGSNEVKHAIFTLQQERVFEFEQLIRRVSNEKVAAYEALILDKNTQVVGHFLQLVEHHFNQLASQSLTMPACFSIIRRFGLPVLGAGDGDSRDPVDVRPANEAAVYTFLPSGMGEGSFYLKWLVERKRQIARSPEPVLIKPAAQSRHGVAITGERRLFERARAFFEDLEPFRLIDILRHDACDPVFKTEITQMHRLLMDTTNLAGFIAAVSPTMHPGEDIVFLPNRDYVAEYTKEADSDIPF